MIFVFFPCDLKEISENAVNRLAQRTESVEVIIMSRLPTKSAEYVDYLCLDKSWRPAFISSSSSTSLELIVPYQSAFIQVQVPRSSPQVALFRTHTKKGHFRKYFEVEVEIFEPMNKLVSLLLHPDLRHSEKTDRVQTVRGMYYFTMDSVFRELVSGEGLFDWFVEGLDGLVDFGIDWMRNCERFLGCLEMTWRNPKAIYSSEDAGMASCYPELFSLLGRLLIPKKGDVIFQVSSN